MFGLQGTLIAGALGIAALAGLGYLWKNEQVKVARLESELHAAMANTETLKAALDEQKASVENMKKLAETNQEQVNALTQQLAEANARTAIVRAEIESLRSAEENRALAAPFERGNAARERFSDSMRRISGETGRASRDRDSADAAGAGSAP